MMRKMIIDGNEAVSRIAYLFTELAGIYPITPSSPMAEHMEIFAAQQKKNLWNEEVQVVEMQSEAGAAGVLHGALQAGSFATTFTASQGLLLMIPNMYKMAGEMLPCVMHVAARSLSTHALSILGDHQDIYATRMTGFNMLSSSSVEEAGDMAAIAHLSAIHTSLPFLHFFDGFRTSHELNTISLLGREELEPLLNQEAIKKFKNRSLLKETYTVGTNQNDDIYFQFMEAKNQSYNVVATVVNDYMQKINKIKGTNYHPFTYYGSEKATEIIIAMGSVCETVKETVDVLNKQGYQVGLVIVHLYRPFSPKYLKEVLPSTVKKIAVLDRTKEHGSIGEPLYLDVKSVLSNIEVYGGRYGLSSKNTTPACIKAVYDFLKEKPFHNFTIGIHDDVTNLSLSIDETFKLENSKEILIYGYGSDGMISASKSLIKILGTTSNYYVQGYFQYDSKKSGGVTISHLRVSDNSIHSTYYVDNPSFVVVSKDTYLLDFECFNTIKENGIVLINTMKTEEEMNHYFTSHDKELFVNRKIKVYIIDAYRLAKELGLKNKISMIMESAMMYLLNMDYEVSKKELITYIRTKFMKKGQEVIDANIESLEKSISYLKEITVTKDEKEKLDLEEDTIFTMLHKRKGDSLPTSAFINHLDGRFSSNECKVKNRAIATLIPRWIRENCISCNQCAFVCPHSVIRPFLLSEEEWKKAPKMIQERVKKAVGPGLSDYYYMIAISAQNCTGCGLCIKTCPSMKKALENQEIDEAIKNQEQEIFDYLVSHVTEKEVGNKYTIKNSQFRTPKFEFCGACAGCGETSYIKLLTQLFGNQLVIANATGCSSIYGASLPSLPYQVSWASSLFEDNAEFGYGMVLANEQKQKSIRKIVEEHKEEVKEELQTWLDYMNEIDRTKEVYENLKNKTLSKELEEIKNELPAKTIWCIGGDGWAYDIGYGGIDHVLASNDNINILVLDTEVYSNTGGQSSKSSPKGTIAPFTTKGKTNAKKDLAAIAMMYPNTYVAQVSLGGNMQQVINVMKEAANYHGPSIIIAYSPCISHGIKGGMVNSLESSKLAVQCGYYPIFHRNPITKEFKLDYKKVNFDLYEDYLNTQTRYQMLSIVNPDKAKELLENNKQDAIRRFKYYESLENSSKEEKTMI